MEVLLYFGLPTKNEHDDFSRPQKFIAYPQPHEILKCRKKFIKISGTFLFSINGTSSSNNNYGGRRVNSKINAKRVV